MNRQRSNRAFLPCAVLCLIAALCGPLAAWSRAAEAAGGAPDLGIAAAPWEEAGRLFRSDPRWLGGDGASSVDLEDGRILWLFGDSFIDPSASGKRRLADLVRNSIAVQSGADPATATMAFCWRMEGGGRPAPFFAHKGGNWYWPASGIKIGRHLLIFLMEIGSVANELGFEARGWKGVWVHNPHESPERWRLTYLVSPRRGRLVVGSGSPRLEKGFLHVFAADEKDRSVYLVRWPEAAARRGTLTTPQWWAGAERGWTGAASTRAPLSPVMAGGQMEFSVEFAPRLGRYLQVQTLDLLNPCLAVSSAPALTGPWSARRCFFTPPEQGRPDLLIYAGKSHPALGGAGMAFTYVANTPREELLLGDMQIYFPLPLRGEIAAPGMAEQ
jgi:hypothetical protein